jgi:MFS family permease
LKDKHFALLIPWFMDGALAMVSVAVPLLALRYGATALMLGTIGWVPQLVRFPLCLTSGHLSEKLGRKAIIIPSAIAAIIGSIAISLARNNLQILIPYGIVIVSLGGFYPPLQARIGDVSRRGELTKNLSWFNMGWCIGGAACAMLAAALVAVSLQLVLYVAAAGALTATVLVVLWKARAHPPEELASELESQAVAAAPAYLLFVARMTHFSGFFGEGIVKVLFPKLARSLGWSEATTASVVAVNFIGVGVSMIVCATSPWWRGKVWPQIASQAVFVACGVGMMVTTSTIVASACFFGIGGALGVGYSAALYHGLSSRKNRGKNTGIHEAIVSAAGLASCLLGGWAADRYSLRAPYIMFSVLAAACLITTAVLALRRHEPAA